MYILYIIIYSLIMYAVQPVIWLRLLWRSKRIPEYRYNWLNRYGFHFYNKNIKPYGIILHAVSLGETLSTRPLIKALLKYYPNITITLTSMTPSGLKLANQFIPHDNIQCTYLPYDLPGSMKRFIKHIKPTVVIIMETELWPNFINILSQNNIPIIIANARLSIHSFDRYKKIHRFLLHIMQRITVIAAQNKSDAYRFRQLGFKKNQLYVTGNLKFNITINQNLRKKIKNLKNIWIKDRLTWIASSTHSGEETLLLAVHKQLLTIFPDLLMILAPRHPDRFFYVSQITKKFGFSYIIKSKGIAPTKNTQIVINDTLGELMLLYGIADIAFIGGSLVPHGGHNPLEAAAHAIPIIMGPHTFNFHDICAKLLESKGLINITDSQSLINTITTLLKHQNLRIYHGNNALTVLKKNQKTLKQLLHILNHYLPIQNSKQ